MEMRSSVRHTDATSIPTNRSFPRRQPLAAVLAFAAAHELAAPSEACVNDAESIAAAVVTAQTTMAFAAFFSLALHGPRSLPDASNWALSGNSVTSDIRVMRSRCPCKDVQPDADSPAFMTQGRWT